MALRIRSTRRRTEGEIVIDILRAIHEKPLNPTNLMYTANLSWDVLKRKFLPPLLVLKLVISKETEGDDRTRQIYQLTRRGETIVNAYKKYKIITFALERMILNIPKNRRNKMDLIIDILLATETKKGITQLQKQTKMGWKSLRRYLEIMRRGNLIMVLGKRGERPQYQITKTGLELIELHRNATLYVTQVMRDESLDKPFTQEISFSKTT